MNDDPLEQVPTHVIASARLVCEWFDANTQGDWSLGGLCSRSMVEKAERQRDRLAEALRGLVAAEDQFVAETGLQTDDLVTDALIVARDALAAIRTKP